MALQLYQFLLHNRRFYSYEINYVSQNLNIPLKQLYMHTRPTFSQRYFQHLTGDSINIFTYNDVIYIGLESERIRYEQDKLSGSNYVEKLIKDGYYERPRNENG